MDNKNLFKKIITEKRTKSSNERPKYGLRKLTVGMVSCLLGYMMFMTPNVTFAENVDAPQAVEANVESTKANAGEEVEQPNKEVVKPTETKAADLAKSSSVAKQSAVQPRSATTTETASETNEKATEFKLTDEQKKQLEDAGFDSEQIQVIVNEIKTELAKNKDFDIPKFIEERIAEIDKIQPVNASENENTRVRDASEPEDTTVGKDANNAVHAYVGVVNGLNIDADLSKASDHQFKPIAGVKAYFQWFETWGNKQYSSPVYTATSGADGQIHMGIKPYVAEDGRLIKFDADPTVSAGNERYRFWIDESTVPKGYQLQYITGESVIFPDKGLPITQGGSGSNTARNIHGNWKILLMEKPLEQMHKKATPTEKQHDGGYLTGTVGWDYKSGVGGIQWNTVADTDTPAKDITVKASYLSDDALKEIYSKSTAVMMGVAKPSDIRGNGWTAEQEKKLQDWIKEQVKKDPDKWIAETVSAKTNADGKYIIQFKGTWGDLKNRDAGLKNYTYKAGQPSSGQVWNKWTKEQIDRLGKVADKANNGSFNYAGTPTNKVKHVNYDWLFVSVENADHLRVMTPYNNNQYTQMSNVFGINGSWSGTGFGVGVTNTVPQILRADFAVAPGEIKFNITNYDSGANKALPGDVAKTSTEGLPYHGESSDNFRIVWYDEDGNQVHESSAQKPSSTGSLESADFDTSKVTKTTNYTAKLYRVDSLGNNAELLAQDSFTVKVNDKIGSLYEKVEFKNKAIKDATYKAKGLPEGLTIDSSTGKVSGTPTKAGKFDVTVTASQKDEAEPITINKKDEYIITDSPLKDGSVDIAYDATIAPTPIDGYVFENVKAKFINGKEIAGLTITDDKISGTPKSKVDATQENPNVEVTYDIYQLRPDGNKFLLKKGHVDKAPLSIKDSESTKYEPKYTAVDGKVGEEVTVAAPTFTDKDNKPATPTGVTYELGMDAPAGAQVDANTGAVTYTPKAGEEGTAINVPVVVKYSDGTKDNAIATINVAKKDSDIYTPAYAVKDGKAGTPVTTDAPKFTGADGNETTAPQGTKYTLGDKAPEGATIDETTGKVTYTPKESDAGKPVEIPVVITYPDKSTDNATVKINVAKLDDVIDRTDDQSQPTPAGYVRVTIDAGEGTKLANGQTKKVYDVKSGYSLTEAQYPTLEITDANNYKKPITWTVAPDTAIDKAVDIVGNATKTDANTNTPTAKAITTDINVVPEAKTGIENVADMPEGTSYAWKTNPDVSKVTEDGKPVKATVVVTYPDKTTDEVEVEITVKDTTPAQKTADKYTPEYTEADAQVGKTTTISAPNFKDAKGKDTTKPEETKFALGKGAPAGATIDETTGEIKYTPADGTAGTDVKIPVVVTYKDGSTDNVDALIKVAPKEKSATPVIDDTKAGARKITGTGTKGATVTVTRGEDVLGEVTVKDDRTWEVTVPEGETLAENDVIKATQQETGKDLSDEATKTVAKAEKPEDGKTSVDENGKKPVKPTDDKQDTGVKVTNPDKDTKVSAKDEDGKDVPVEIDENGNIVVTPGKNVDGPIKVTVEDPDLPGGKVEVEVEVEGHKKGKDDNGSDTTPEDKKTSVDETGKKPVKPTDDKQDTGVKVINPDKDTKVSAKDEDGKDVPVEIDGNGNIVVTPGKNVDGPITVTVENPDLPGGKVEVVVEVEGHKKGQDDNGSDKKPEDGKTSVDETGKKPVKPTDDKQDKPSKNLPKTGATNNLSMFAGIMGMAGSLLALIGFKKGKKEDEQV